MVIMMMTAVHRKHADARAPADALGHLFDKRLQLGLARRRDASDYWRLGTDEIRAVEHEHVEMNVEIERRAEALSRAFLRT